MAMMIVLFPVMAFKGKSHVSINKMVLAFVTKIVVNTLFIVEARGGGGGGGRVGMDAGWDGAFMVRHNGIPDNHLIW